MKGRTYAWDFSAFLVAFLLLLHQHQLLVNAQRSKSPWKTLTGDTPKVIAKGGFSGLFPDSSQNAYSFALDASSPDTIFWCDVRLTKDGVGICLPDIKLDNCTDISSAYPAGKKVYLVNGVSTPGWFSVDYTLDNLSSVSLTQSIYSRAPYFDGLYPILTVDYVETQFQPPALWLNIQHDIFYRQHNLSMRSYVLSVSRRVIVNYVSSPEVAFLSSIVARFNKSKTKLIFRFLDKDTTEPSTNQTYGSLLKNLTFIKTFASGILVPKHYIWPVTSDLYLLPYTSIVLDAHKQGLEIFASDFANDAPYSYNYSYDPLAEYLYFVDNDIFSVDGVLTDFPITPSEAIGCFSHINKNNSVHGKPIVISHNGASGMYPDCTDLAYEQAVIDGADFIDCPVQVTKDGIPICMSSINLIEDTTVTRSPFSSRSSLIPEIQATPGIFTFNLTWEEIQKNLKPQISVPDITYKLVRNPAYKNAGNFMKLSDFLAFAKGKSSGVLIGIEYAAFLAENIGFSVTDAVVSALNDSGYNNQTVQEVMIQSSNSSVLKRFKQETKYKLVYMVDESIRDADPSSIKSIKQFADSVAITKQSIYPESLNYITQQTKVVKSLQTAGLSVYVYVLRNEFISLEWDFLYDPTVQINSFVADVGVDGLITDFPGTATAYKRNTCSNLGNNTPTFMSPVQVGGLLQVLPSGAQPPALAPMPVLDVSNVVEPPLPAAVKPAAPAPTSGGATSPPGSTPSSGPQRTDASIIFSLSLLFGSLLLI